MIVPAGPVLVTLVGGEIVTSDAEAWRHQREAEAILALPSVEDRRAWLHDLEHGWTSASGRFIKGRGTAAVDALRATMQQLFDARQGA